MCHGSLTIFFARSRHKKNQIGSCENFLLHQARAFSFLRLFEMRRVHVSGHLVVSLFLNSKIFLAKFAYHDEMAMLLRFVPMTTHVLRLLFTREISRGQRNCFSIGRQTLLNWLLSRALQALSALLLIADPPERRLAGLDHGVTRVSNHCRRSI